MEVALTILSLVAVVVGVSALANRYQLPAPLMLVIVGIGASFLPFVPELALTPELVLIGLLPPLLYAAAIRTSLVDVKAERRAIGLLAVGLVAFTTVIVGLVAWWLLPIPFAAALAFGAVVAPPDAVAATAIARRIGLPRRIVTILEGESLLNDATALVALRTAIAAITVSVSIQSVGLSFLWAAVGGVLIGVLVGLAVALVRRKIKDPIFDTAVSLMTPFLAYLPAEEVHSSGVVAVVTTGLILGHKAPLIQDATARLNERINWTTIQFLLENTVFLLIGLQLQAILQAVSGSDLGFGTVAAFCVGSLLAVIISRPLWVFPIRYLLIKPTDERGQPTPWTYTAVASWAGMRGVVTLAAAFVLPDDVPHVDTLRLGAFVVTAATLLLQGLTLPWMARRLGVRGPDAREDTLQEASVLQTTVTAGNEELDRLVTPEDDEEVVAAVRSRANMRLNSVWERLGNRDDGETPSEQYQRLRIAVLGAERAAVLRIRNQGVVDSDVLAAVMNTLDSEEALVAQVARRTQIAREQPLTTPDQATGECPDLEEAPATIRPLTPGGCPDCEREGLRWVHLRLCLTCGNVGCCDSSVGKHADKHNAHTDHPVMRSFEPGEAWRWCYRHELLG